MTDPAQFVRGTRSSSTQRPTWRDGTGGTGSLRLGLAQEAEPRTSAVLDDRAVAWVRARIDVEHGEVRAGSAQDSRCPVGAVDEE